MDRNTILAIVLSVVIWLGYFYLFGPEQGPKPPKQKPSGQQTAQKTPSQDKKQKQARAQQATPKKPSPPQAKQQEQRPAPPRIRALDFWQQKAQEFTKTLTVDTKLYRVTVRSQGAAVTSFRYKKYQDDHDKPVELVVRNKRYPGPKLWPFGLSLNAQRKDFMRRSSPLDALPYQLSQKQVTLQGQKGQQITATTQVDYQGTPLRLDKIYTFFPDKRYFRLKLRITNLGEDKAFSAKPMLRLGYLVGPDLDLDDPFNPMELGYYAGEEYEEIDKEGGFFSDDPPPFTRIDRNNIHWAGIHSRYFLLGVIPQQPVKQLWADTRPDSPFHLGVNLNRIRLQGGQKWRHSLFVYVGEKEKDVFAQFQSSIEQLGYTWTKLGESLKNTIDVHWSIEIIRDLLVKILIWLNMIFHNYGWSIVVFAVITKIIFWPLNQKSANSMKKMSELSPQLKDLKEKYKDDPQEMNKRTMELYKKHKVNPASGCLPILIQLPFFIALYSALSNSAVLWNAPFIWWMQDLSAPDTVAQLPDYLGALEIKILPLLMVISQFLQQKVTTSSADPNQQKMMMIMPLVLIFIFWQMPSGLVLYWTIQNILAIAQQLYTNHRGKKAQPA